MMLKFLAKYPKEFPDQWALFYFDPYVTYVDSNAFTVLNKELRPAIKDRASKTLLKKDCFNRNKKCSIAFRTKQIFD